MSIKNPKASEHHKPRTPSRKSLAEKALTSIATMLGWMNTPPLHVIERDIRALKARVNDSERLVIDHCVAHWDVQGGAAEFGELGHPTNPDELISTILQKVRARGDHKHWTTDA